MHIGAILKSFIYLISSSLLYPVLFLLSGLTVWILLQAGAFLAEWLARSRLTRIPSQELPDVLPADKVGGSFPYEVAAYLRSLRAVLDGPGPRNEAVIEDLLRQSVSNLCKPLDKLMMLVRIGPGLGLAGTLIPMGTGLAALGQGDMSKLSSDLVIAFTTTVVGLTLGMLAYFFHMVRRRWAEEDIRAMEFITEILAGQPTGGQKNEVYEEKTNSAS